MSKEVVGAGTSGGTGGPRSWRERKCPILPGEIGPDLNTVLTVFPEHPGLKEMGP